MSGIVIRDEAMARLVPVGTVVLDQYGERVAIGDLDRPRDMVGATITHIAVPVDVAQAMRAEMLAEADKWDTGPFQSVGPMIREWVERLFPAAIFAPPPAPEPPAEVDAVTISVPREAVAWMAGCNWGDPWHRAFTAACIAALAAHDAEAKR